MKILTDISKISSINIQSLNVHDSLSIHKQLHKPKLLQMDIGGETVYMVDPIEEVIRRLWKIYYILPDFDYDNDEELF